MTGLSCEDERMLLTHGLSAEAIITEIRTPEQTGLGPTQTHRGGMKILGMLLNN